jgi:hypothetical protein
MTNYTYRLPAEMIEMAEAMSLEEYQQWVATRKEAGAKIDIATCWVGCWGACDMDPYGCDPDLPEEYLRWGETSSCARPTAAAGFMRMICREPSVTS